MPKFHAQFTAVGGEFSFSCDSYGDLDEIISNIQTVLIPSLSRIKKEVDDATAKADRQREAGTPQGTGADEEAKAEGKAGSKGTPKEATEGVD